MHRIGAKWLQRCEAHGILVGSKADRCTYFVRIRRKVLGKPLVEPFSHTNEGLERTKMWRPYHKETPCACSFGQAQARQTARICSP